jgi:hypothetical protein
LPARTQSRVGDPDLNDPQILLVELAHGMLVDTETYIDCPYRYWRVAQVPGRRSVYDIQRDQGWFPRCWSYVCMP